MLTRTLYVYTKDGFLLAAVPENEAEDFLKASGIKQDLINELMSNIDSGTPTHDFLVRTTELGSEVTSTENTKTPQKRFNHWNVYSAYTHKLVATTDNLKEWCAAQDGMPDSAHYHIYKTNNTKVPEGQRPLTTYRGFFIRIQEEVENGTAPKFPALKVKEPDYFDVYRFNADDEHEKLGRYTKLQDFCKEYGLEKRRVSYLKRTYQTDEQGQPLQAKYLDYFVRPAESKLPDPRTLSQSKRGKASFIVYDKELNVVEVTKSITEFAKSQDFKWDKPLYKTNSPKENELTPASSFYLGFCVRKLFDVIRGESLPLPDISEKNIDSSALDLLVWKAAELPQAQALVVRSYEKYRVTDKLDKDELYSVAAQFSWDPSATSKDGYQCIFINTLLEDREGTMDTLTNLGVKLPKNLQL
ncbi:hypothetical protein AB4254_09370 [Vibrio breoganii]